MEIGTLVVVVLKARNLRDIHSFYKQDVYAQISLNGRKQITHVELKGGQHPVWDEELRFPVLKGEGEKERKLEVSCFAKESKVDEELASGKVDISETLKTGEFDDWVPLVEPAGQQRGDLYLEMTYFTNAPPPPNSSKPVNKLVANVNGANLQRRPSKLPPAERLARPPDSLLPNRPRPSNLSGVRPIDVRKDVPHPNIPPASLAPSRFSPPKPVSVPNMLKPGPASRPPDLRRTSDPFAPGLAPNEHNGQRRRVISLSPPHTPNPYLDPPKPQSPPRSPPLRDGPSFPIAMPSASPTPVPEVTYNHYTQPHPQSPLQPTYQQQTYSQIPQPVLYQQSSYNVQPQYPPHHSYSPSPQPPQHAYSPSSPQPSSHHSYSPSPQPSQHSYSPSPQPSQHSYSPSPQPPQTCQQPYQSSYTSQPQAHQQYPQAPSQQYIPQPALPQYSEQPRITLAYSPGPQAAPQTTASNGDGMPDPYLNARYTAPLPLPPTAQPPPRTSSANDKEREEQDRILREAEKKKEQEEKDMEMARMLDKELNLGGTPASSGRRQDRWRDSAVGSQAAMPGDWGR